MNRQVGLAALAGTAVEWHIVFTSPSHQGLGAAVLAGLGITILTLDDLEPGIEVVDGQYGLPSLPKVDFTLVWGKSGQTLATREFAQMILNMPQPRPLSLQARNKSQLAQVS